MRRLPLQCWLGVPLRVGWGRSAATTGCCSCPVGLFAVCSPGSPQTLAVPGSAHTCFSLHHLWLALPMPPSFVVARGRGQSTTNATLRHDDTTTDDIGSTQRSQTAKHGCDQETQECNTGVDTAGMRSFRQQQRSAALIVQGVRHENQTSDANVINEEKRKCLRRTGTLSQVEGLTVKNKPVGSSMGGEM